MYSQHTLDTYPQLLKAAGFAFREELEKDAGRVGDFFGALRGGARRVAGAGHTATQMAESGAAHLAAQRGAKAAVKPLSEAGVMAEQALRSPNGSAAAARAPGVSAATGERAMRGATGEALSDALPAMGPAEPRITDTASRASGLEGVAGPTPAAAAVGKMGWKGKAGIGLGAAGLGAGAYGLGQHNQAQADKTTRNVAFGAGAAAGLAAPTVLRGIGNTASGLAMSPTSLLSGGY